MNIVLIGYRGTGKSVVGQILAHRLHMAYEGMDANIVRRAGMPIPQIVEDFGWAKFRDIETEEALDLSGKDHQIIGSGFTVGPRKGGHAARVHSRHLARDLLHVVGIDVAAALDDHLLGAAGDEQPPAVHVTEIARVQPSVDQRFRGGLIVSKVTIHHRGAFYPHLAHHALGRHIARG